MAVERTYKTIDMKDFKNNIEQTCIDFGKFVTAKEDWTASTEYMTELWNQFQEQQAEDINDILDEIAPNDKLKEAAIKHNEMIRQKLEEAEEEGFDDDLMETDYKGFDSTQDKINHEMLQLIAENNAVNDKRYKETCDVIEILTKVCNVQDKYINNLQSQIKLTDTIVSANNIALNNIEENVSKDIQNETECNLSETFKKSAQEMEDQFWKQKDECTGNGVLDAIEPETKQMDIADAHRDERN